jgi:hypothetical protein
MNKLIILSFAIFLISLTGVMAMVYYCGDSVCNGFETDILTAAYCPEDCGILVNRTSCETSFPPECPTCPSPTTCPTCDTSRLTTVELTTWCDVNGYSVTGANYSAGSSGELNKYIWLIVIAVILYLIFNRRKKHER